MVVAALIRLITGVHARWAGVEPTRPDGSIPPRVYFANHCSHLDAAVIWASLPTPLRRLTRPVAARDYWERGPVRRYLARRVFRAVLIERHKVTVSSNPLAAMQAVLDEGCSLIVFPEGTRTDDADDGHVGDFKPGLYHLARRYPQAEFVPVHLENLNRILPKGEFILVPLLAGAVFGPPVRLEDGEEKSAFLARAKAAVEALGDDADRGMSTATHAGRD